MNKDDIIRMVRESSMGRAADGWGFEFDQEQLERFAALVAAAEREACAKVCEEMASWHGDLVTAAYESAADAIRARGQS